MRKYVPELNIVAGNLGYPTVSLVECFIGTRINCDEERVHNGVAILVMIKGMVESGFDWCCCKGNPEAKSKKEERGAHGWWFAKTKETTKDRKNKQ